MIPVICEAATIVQLVSTASVHNHDFLVCHVHTYHSVSTQAQILFHSSFRNYTYTHLISRIHRDPCRCFLSLWGAWFSFPAQGINARHSTCTKNISVCTKVRTEKTRGLKRSPAERIHKDCRHRSPFYRPDVRSCRSLKEKKGAMKGNSISLHSCEAWQRTWAPCHRINPRFQYTEQAGELQSHYWAHKRVPNRPFPSYISQHADKFALFWYENTERNPSFHSPAMLWPN